MAGGKYVKRRRTLRANPFKKIIRKTSAKTIRKIAVKAIKSQAETKNYFYHYTNQNMLGNAKYAINPYYDITQGTGDMNRIGDKIHVASVTWRINLLFDPAFFTASRIPQSFLRIYVVQHKARNNNGITGSIQNWVGDNPMKAGYPTNGIFDYEKFTILKSKTIKIMPMNNTSKQNIYTSMAIYPKKSIHYDSDNGGFLRFKNTYLIYELYSPETFVSGAITINVLQNTKFKDL